jgi:hypothetical protein
MGTFILVLLAVALVAGIYWIWSRKDEIEAAVSAEEAKFSLEVNKVATDVKNEEVKVQGTIIADAVITKNFITTEENKVTVEATKVIDEVKAAVGANQKVIN